MGKLSSDLRKNENDIDVTLSDILTKITRKYLEILEIKFIRRNPRWCQPRPLDDWESLATLSNGLLVYIGVCCCYPCLQFIFGVALSFVGLLLNRTPLRGLQSGK